MGICSLPSMPSFRRTACAWMSCQKKQRLISTVIARFLNIENFSFERQDGLKASVAALFGGSTGGFSFHQEQLAAFRVSLLAIGEFPGQPAGIERALAAR